MFDHGSSKGSFHINAKIFSLSFDGGQSDLFAHESNVMSSIWVGHKGMEWILSCFADICDWVLGNDFLCKRLQENNKNNKLLEFCGRSNKAGLFVVIAVYYG